MVSAIPDQILRIRKDGTFLEQTGNEVPAPPGDRGTAGPRLQDAPVPEEAKARFLDAVARTLDTGVLHTVEYRLPSGGDRPEREARLVPCGEDEVLGLVRDITDRKRSEEALRILEHTAVGLAFVRNRVFEWMNPPFERIFGLPVERFAGSSTRLIYPDEEAYEALGREAYPTLALGRPSDSELQLRHGDGSLFWGRLVGMALDPARSQEGSIWLLEDITARRLAEEQVEEKLSLFQALLEAIPNPVFFKGADLRYQGCNSAMERFLGLPRERLIGRTAREIEPPSLAEIHPGADEALLASGGTQVYQTKAVNAQAEARDVIFHRAVLRDRAGEVNGMVGLLTDITEREASARELARTQRLLEAVLEQSPTPILVVDAPDAVLRICNHAAREFLGVQDEPRRLGLALEAIQSSWEIQSPDGERLPPEENPLARALQGQSTPGLELRVVRKDGSVRICMGYGVPVRSWEGRLIAAMAIFPDITEQRRAEEALRQARKMESLGLMASGIAHDFNNLFQMLRGLLEQAGNKSPVQAARSVRRALDVLDRAVSLSDRMLDYSGKSHRKPEALDLNQLVLEAVDLLPGLGHPMDHLSLALDATLSEIVGDRSQLRRVISALLANALEATGGAQAPVEVSTTEVSWQELQQEPRQETQGLWMSPARAESLVCLRVRDRGEGIPPERLSSIFDPFFSTRGLGRGLGLAASLGILRAHRAGLHVCSAPGQGSCFRVFLPIQSTARIEECPRPCLHAGRTILLVDDEPLLLEVLGEAIRVVMDLPVLVARDGQEAVEIYRSHADAIGLVIMDATMPRMSGPEAFEAMKRIRPGVQGFLCSGFSEQFGEETARSFGFLGFLKKPFGLEALQGAIRGALAP